LVNHGIHGRTYCYHNNFFILGRLLDLALVKTGKIFNKDVYTLNDIAIMKRRGFLYMGSAYIRFTKVPEVVGIGYKKQQKMYSEL